VVVHIQSRKLDNNSLFRSDRKVSTQLQCPLANTCVYQGFALPTSLPAPPLHFRSIHPSSGKEAYPISDDLREYVVNTITNIVDKTLATFFQNQECSTGWSTSEAVDGFLRTYGDRPITKNAGGCQFSNALWLYVITRYLNPGLVVESGVWKGQSLYYLIAATDPSTRMYGYDIKLFDIPWAVDRIKLAEQDWSVNPPSVQDGETGLIHFDDHINQARRILEAKEQGFKYLLFDDNLPVYQIFKDRDEIVPTVDMLFDTSITRPLSMRWNINGRDSKAEYNPADFQQHREAVKSWVNLPELDIDSRALKTRLGFPSKFAFVILND